MAAQTWWRAEFDRLPQTFPFVARVDHEVEVYRLPEPDGGYLNWTLNLFDAENRPIHRASMPLHRMIYLNLPLRGSEGSGPVLYNNITCLSPEYQRRGLGKHFEELDERFCREFRFRELQLNAGCEALTNNHWQRKHKFVPSLNAQVIIQQEWAPWCRAEKREVGTIDASDWLSLPEDFRLKWLKPNFANSEHGALELYKAVS